MATLAQRTQMRKRAALEAAAAALPPSWMD